MSVANGDGIRVAREAFDELLRQATAKEQWGTFTLEIEVAGDQIKNVKKGVVEYRRPKYLAERS